MAGSEDFFLVNPLSRQADVLGPDEARAYEEGRFLEDPEFIEKGYVVDRDREARKFRQAYLDFMDERDNDEIQLFFVPWYACNFACSYCFQDEYAPQTGRLQPEVVDAFFAYVDQHFAGRRKYLTLFGGEPLLPGKAQRESIALLLEGANKRKLDVALVTNGYRLQEYIDLLEQTSIREIQVTLDGPREIHDARRMLKGGKGSFDRIVEGVDALLERQIPVNLRVVVDRDNLQHLPALADFARERGWTSSPVFKTALGRNYELHHCQTARSRLFSRLEMYEELYKMVEAHPSFLDFHKPAFSIAAHLFDSGEMPHPLFDSCSGTKTEWAFDYTGQIYACTATVGNAGDELGTFYPEVVLKEDSIELWEDRDVMAIEACRDCSVQLACGGGCAAIARSKSGKLQGPDCRPVKSLLELGIGLYSRLPLETEQ